MAATIQIRLKKSEMWMKDVLLKLKSSDDPRFHNRSESEISKMLLRKVLESETEKTVRSAKKAESEGS